VSPHYFFRDHDTPGWGVARAHSATSASGDTIVTGLDKNVAAAIACLLNGDIDDARILLHTLPDHME